jgi:hypothetical protein
VLITSANRMRRHPLSLLRIIIWKIGKIRVCGDSFVGGVYANPLSQSCLCKKNYNMTILADRLFYFQLTARPVSSGFLE